MKKEIGKNVSSGAEKVERLEEHYTQENVDEQKSEAPQKTSKAKSSGSMSKTKSKTPKTAVKRERVAAEKRVKEATVRAEKKKKEENKKLSAKQAKIEKKALIKQKKLEKKQAIAEKKLAHKKMVAKKRAERIANREKRKADLKAKRAQNRAEKSARRELLKNESKSERANRRAREKNERLALKRQKQEARVKAREDKLKAREAARVRRSENRKHKREQKTKRRTAGFGGWLAAVISLGTACLVLSAIVTAGAFRMNDMAVDVEGGYRSTLYEMTSVSEELDDDFSKLRVSSGVAEQRRLLTDILVKSALLENAIERMPIDQATSTDIYGFVNRTGTYANRLLGKLSAGETLSIKDKEHIAHLYEINDKLYNELNELIVHMTASDLKELMSGGGDTVQKFGEMIKGENKEKELRDAPFAKEGNVGENRLMAMEEITSAQAEELVRGYFKDYRVKTVRYTGETLAMQVACYNFVLTDENDVEIYAEITKRGGKLAFFDTYEECTNKNFDLNECDGLAREYLKKLGIENVEAVWLSDGGMVANLTYTTVIDGVRVYPEIIRVRVCEEKGRVIGLDARGYLLNDKKYSFDYSLTKEEARGHLSEGLEVSSTRLALIPVRGKEVLSYEFYCSLGDDEYIVYVDANTGDEVEIFRVRDSAQGKYLR